jgi:TRAP-type mannitol/chloroaromatic compound transport system permease small subunit
MDENPYRPPSGNEDRDRNTYDDPLDVVGECFAWFILIISFAVSCEVIARAILSYVC